MPNTLSRWATAYSAKPPCAAARTRSPTERPVTPPPIAETVPAISCPGVCGKRGFTW